MLTVYLTGTNAEYMHKFMDFLGEALVDDLDENLYSISIPREYADGEVIMRVTIGEDKGEDENVMDLSYDDMFMPKEHMTPTRRKWNL